MNAVTLVSAASPLSSSQRSMGRSLSAPCRTAFSALIWCAELAVILAWGYALLVWFPLLVGGAS